MPSDLVDRLRGVKSSQAIKVPCRVATTANITLSGEQTIDGVAVVDGDRVLVKNQSTASENGVYECDTSTWSRTPDWDGTGDVVTGTRVYVTAGSTNKGEWVVTTTGTITIGTTSVALSGGTFDKNIDTSDDITEGSTKLLMTVAERARLDAYRSLEEQSPTGDGSADDETAVDAFITAVAGKLGIVPPGTYKATNIAPAAASHIAGVSRYLSEFKRDSDGSTFVSLNGVDGFSLSDFSLDLDYTTNGDSGHAVSIVDSDYIDLRYLRARNFGNNGGSAGTGFLAFSSTGTIRNVSFDHLIAIADDSDSDNTNGYVIEDGRYCHMAHLFAEGAIAYGIEYKNDTRYSVMAASVAVDCGFGFGYGQDTVGDDGCDFNVAGLLAAYACDYGLVLGEADYNVFSGMVVDSTDAPNRDGSGDYFGARFFASSDGNLLSSLLTFGANMDYPLRFAGARNYASIASHDAASRIVTFDSGAVKNFVEVLHPGTRTTIASAILDNSGVDIDSTDANVVHSPMTGEYYGSMSGFYHWKLAASGASPASTHLWRYETDGNNIIGLISPGATGESYGISVNIVGTTNYAAMLYSKAASGASEFWQWRVNNAAQLRLFDGVLRPETNDDIALGTSSVGFMDLFLASGGEIRVNNAQVLDTVGGLSTQTAAATAIAAVANAINTANKRAGKMVFDTTNNRLMIATGSAAADPWRSADGGTTVNPA